MTEQRKSEEQLDRELVQAMALGDRRALEVFYQRHNRAVIAILVRILRSTAEAEEMQQEVFFELWRRAPQYDPCRGSVKAWINQLAKCRAIDAQRARQRRCYDRHQPVETSPMAANDNYNPHEVTETRARTRRVRRAMGTLPPAQRESVTMSFYSGLSHREISQELGVPLGTVKSRILSGMKRLKTTLSQPTAEWQMAEHKAR